MTKADEKITIGSGDLYVVEFAGIVPEHKTLETEANRLGYIKGGAELTYKGDWYEASDDLGHVCRSLMTKEEASIKSGILTWSGNTLKVLSATARMTELSGHRTLKIGGLKNQNSTKYIIHFVHTDESGLKTRITIVGKNQSGFSLPFLQDKETVVDAEFKAEPCDNEGTLIVYDEEIPIVPPAKNV